MAKLTLFLTLLSTILTVASAAPTSFAYPLSNGFPNPNQSQLTTIEQQAHGTLPNTPPPSTLDPESETALGLIAFNELFEVAFFTQLLNNITSAAPGYTDVPNRDQVLSTLHAVVAQEQLHELSANGAFTNLTGKTIQPCNYTFPVDSFNASIALASKFTDLFLGTLADVQTIFASHNDTALIGLVGSIIGQEGEQNGFYRSLLGEVPPALPFLTGGALDFAFNLILQNFVVAGSCPSLDLLVSRGLKQFGVLERQDGSGTNSSSQAFMTYINQQNAPFSVPMTFTKSDGGAVFFFNASFPAETRKLSGLVVAAVTNGQGPFAGPEEVAAATLFGPGLIEVSA
ncbi:hypothetical protein BDY17DRAFT_258230 [Neohortaea acidophila]|uniref:Sexual development protein n=1 Tax=Neohortaea acidophila TaxID=245834 RepID=A0A6A6PF43_9PEZI|nr:uncharacterized protein BDY17DRAFT_258230 [Neohortaea acidophila]KAF2478560.1 hypothetical protein BDY17DRAFT_258230 [Neohortaea acidophila]